MTKPKELPDPRITLASGRQVYIEEVHLRSHYAGHMEGTMEAISKVTLENVPRMVEQFFRKAKPLYIAPSSMPLPSYLVACKLESDVIDPAIETGDDDFYGSSLYLVYFTHTLTRSIATQVRAELDAAGWDQVAEDWAWTF